MVCSRLGPHSEPVRVTAGVARVATETGSYCQNKRALIAGKFVTNEDVSNVLHYIGTLRQTRPLVDVLKHNLLLFFYSLMKGENVFTI